MKRIKDWLRASRRNTLLVVTAAVLLVSGAAAGLAASPLGGGLGEDVDIEPVDNYFLVDKEEYGDVLLETTDDAGEKYIKETLFLGDSNTLRMYMFEMLTLENMIGVESIGIKSARNSECVYFEDYDDPVTMAEAVKLMKPRRVVVCLGTNDLPNLSLADFISEYDGFIDDLQKAYSYTDIIVSAIPPFSAKMERTLKLAKLNSFNVALVELAREKNVKFLDLGEALTDTNGYIKSDYCYTDGIHITKVAATAWLKYVRTHAYETEDRRPKPLGTIPKQKYVPMWNPGDGTGETDEFDLDKVVSYAVSMLNSYGFHTPKQGGDMSTASSYTYTQTSTLKSGDEETLAKDIYLYFLSASGATEGDVSVSYVDNGTSWVFTIKYKAHTFDDTKWVVTKQATCQAEGEETNTCLTCGKTIKRKIAKKEHDLDRDHGVVKVPATCQAEGKVEYTCKVCGTVVTETIPKTDHTWDAGTVTTPATCQAEGVKTYTCTVCGATKTEAIPKTNHTWDAGVVVTPATETSTGVIRYTCTVCGATKDEEIPMLPPGGGG